METLRVRNATLADLDDIMRLEGQCFPSPWPREMFERELAPGPGRLYLALEIGGELVGYGGMWYYANEAHICTVAVAEPWRRTGIGEILVLTLLDEARDRGGRYAVLEYRVTNHAAARLYHKLGFSLVRIRKGYYSDTGEDAAEVAINDLGSPTRQQTITDLIGRWVRERAYDLHVDIG